eukprot:3354459-Lingulodinium_polyedra.AAC.1
MEVDQLEADVSTSAGGVAAGQISVAPVVVAETAPCAKEPPPLLDWHAWGAGATPPPSPPVN